MASKEFEHGSSDNKNQDASSFHSDTEENLQKRLTSSAEQNKPRDVFNPDGRGIKSCDLRLEGKSPEQDGSEADQLTSAASAQLSPEDKQTIGNLYKECPQLWADFRIIVNFLDVLDRHTPVPFALLSEYLEKLLRKYATFPHYDSDGIDKLGQFASVIGFVDQSVALYRQVLRELGQTYVTVHFVGTQNHGGILFELRNLFNLFSMSMHFSLRLVQTGFLKDMLEDLKHMQHMSADALNTSEFVFDLYAKTLLNWYKHAEVRPLVKQNDADIVTALAPFRLKTSQGQDVQALTFTVLSFTVKDEQLDLLRLPTNTAQYLLDTVKEAVDLHKHMHNGWPISTFLFYTSNLTRWEYNRRLLLAQGATKTLRLVLVAPDRTDWEKQVAVRFLDQLTQDPDNLCGLQNDRELTKALETVATTGIEAARHCANDLLTKIQHAPETESEDFATSPSLGDLLADELNMLNISGIGKVEYVMDRLTQFSAEGGRINSTSGVTRLKVLQALTELTRKNDGCRREIMSRGALDKLTKILRNGDKYEKAQAASVLLELASCEENRDIMKNRPAFMVTLSDATVATDNDDLVQTAGIIVQALNQ